MSCNDYPFKRVTIEYDMGEEGDFLDIINEIVYARNHIKDNTVTEIIIGCDKPMADEIAQKIRDRLSHFRGADTFENKGIPIGKSYYFYQFFIGKMVTISIG